jgi:hypothetical protein
MKLALIIPLCVAVSSCSIFNKRDKAPTVTPIIENVDRSGTLHHLGGMLINDHQVIHVTHWPVKIGYPVRLRGIDGVNTHRTIIEKEDIGEDLCVLTLNEPVDLTNHTIIATADPIFHIPTTVFRFEDRPIRGTSVRGYDKLGRVSLSLTPETYLEPGDSGKISVQRQDGSLYVVTLNSTTSGKGPHVHRLLSEWIANDDK